MTLACGFPVSVEMGCPLRIGGWSLSDKPTSWELIGNRGAVRVEAAVYPEVAAFRSSRILDLQEPAIPHPQIRSALQ